MYARRVSIALLFTLLASVGLAHREPGSMHDYHIHHEGPSKSYTAQGLMGCYIHELYNHIQFTHHLAPGGAYQGEDSPLFVGADDHVHWERFLCP